MIDLPKYDYLYSCDYSKVSSSWLKDQLELAKEEGAKDHIEAITKELLIRSETVADYVRDGFFNKLFK